MAAFASALWASPVVGISLCEGNLRQSEAEPGLEQYAWKAEGFWEFGFRVLGMLRLKSFESFPGGFSLKIQHAFRMFVHVGSLVSKMICAFRAFWVERLRHWLCDASYPCFHELPGASRKFMST